MRVFHEDRLPQRWTRYNELDILIASAAVLERLREENVASFEAIRAWVACGGMLWCYGAAPAKSLDSLFGSDLDWEALHPEAVNEGLTQRFASTNGQIATMMGGRYQVAKNEIQVSDNGLLSRRPNQDTVVAGLRTREYLAGRILYIHDAYPFPGSEALWAATFTASRSRIGVSNRLGFDILRGDNSFWEWLIGEVGQPPVYTFLGVITLFALLVGPASYYCFLYLRRLYLFFVFAPVVAVICSIGIGIYAVFADGFGTRVRIRHLTLINEQGDGTVWSRQTYFAGLRPRDGARWSRDLAVFPLKNPLSPGESVNPNDILAADSVVAIDDSSVRFDGQFMPSRRQAQFLSVEPKSGLGSLSIRKRGGAVEIENQLPFAIVEVLVTDDNGDAWLGTSIDAGSIGKAEPLPSVEAAKWKSGSYLDHAPTLPAGYQDASRNKWLNLGRGRQRRRSEFQTHNIGGILESLVRDQLVETRSTDSSGFAAIAGMPDGVIGVEGAEQVESLHMVLGPVVVEGTVLSPFHGDSDAPASDDPTVEESQL